MGTNNYNTAKVMLRKGAFLFGLVALMVNSCIDHEVIPAPVPHVELTCSFEGEIGGAYIEFTENVANYSCFPSIQKQTALGTTKAQYLFAMTSNEAIRYIQIAMGSLTWNDPTGTEIPALTLFNEFFTMNDSPNYSVGALDGFEVTFHDSYGQDWKSDPTQPGSINNVEFTAIKQESDNTGDYSAFTCTFDCTLYHTYSVVDWQNPPTIPATFVDSLAWIEVENAVYKGHFKR